MKNLEELKKIRDRARKDLELRTGKHRIKILMKMDMLVSKWCGKPHPTRL